MEVDVEKAPELIAVSDKQADCTEVFPEFLPYASSTVLKRANEYEAKGGKGFVWSSGYIYNTEREAVIDLQRVISIVATPLKAEPDESDEGPCNAVSGYERGTHQTYGDAAGNAVASIVSCPCCIVDETTNEPVRTRKWAIINLRERYLRDLYEEPFA